MKPIVLVYHSITCSTAKGCVSPSVLEEHINFILEKGFETWGIGQLLDCYLRGIDQKGRL